MLRTFKPEIGDKMDPAGATLALAQGQATTQSILILSGWIGVALVAGVVMTRRRQVS